MGITKEDMSNRRTFMSRLATGHEQIISKTLWTHRHRNPELDNELLVALTDFRQELDNRVNSAIKSTVLISARNNAVDDAYQSMFRTDDSSSEDQKQKSLDFLKLVDKCTGSELEQIAKGLISQTAPGFIDVKMRFVVEEAQILAKHRLKKPRFPVKGTLIPDIKFTKNGSEVLAAQIDGAIVVKGIKTLITESGMAYLWTQIEVKSYHDIDWTIRDSPPLQPHKIHLRQFNQRLEDLFLLCQEKEIDFVLPSHIIFCYLRGLRDDIFYTIPIGISHLVQWRSDIEARFFRENRQLTTEEKKVLRYIDGEVKRRQNKLKKGMKLVKRKRVVTGTDETLSKLELPEKKRRKRNKKISQPKLLDRSPEQKSLYLLQTLEPEPKQKYEIVWNLETKRILRNLLNEIGCNQDAIGGIRRRRNQKQFELPINVFNNSHSIESKGDFLVTLSLSVFLRDFYRSIAEYSNRPFTEDGNLLNLADIYEGDEIDLVLAQNKKNKFDLKKVEIITGGSNLTIK